MGKRRIMLTIGSKLLLYLLAFSLLPLIIGGVISFTVTRKQLEEQVKAHLSDLARDCGRKISYYVSGHYREIRLLSLATVFEGSDTAVMQKYITEMVMAASCYEAITAIDPKGRIIACTREELIGRSRADREWFKATLQSRPGEVIPLDAYRAETAGWEIVIGFNAPIIADSSGEVLGVLTTRISMKHILDRVRMLDERRNIKNNHAYLLNSRGEILAGPDEQDFLKPYRLHDFPEIRELQAGRSGVSQYKNDRGEEVVGARYALTGDGDFNGWGWGIIVNQPVSEAFRAAYTIRDVIVAMMIIMAFLITVSSMIIAKRISRPIREVAESALRISRGNLGSKEIRYKTRDEIGNLVDAFNRMGSNLEATTVSRDSLSREIEGRKGLERQIRQSQKMEAIGTLAGGIAHDFNNILMPIIGYAQMSREELPQESPVQDNLDTILESANRAKELVKQILAFSRHSEDQLKPLKVQPIVKEALKLLRASVPAHIDIRRNLDNNTGAVMGDSTQIFQVIMNICTNSYQAMKEKGGILDVTLSGVDIGNEDQDFSSLNPGPYLLLTVSDTGHGMGREVLERIFEPFFTTRGPAEGTGMGLSVVHGIVRGYGGDIRVYSEPDKGTTFNVYLPRIDNSPESPNLSATELSPTGKEHILLVDDEEIIARMLERMLERLGYRVTARTSSVEALAAFRSQPESFDLVLTDITMPNMSGIDLSEELLRIRGDIPVVLCTGFSETVSREKAMAVGVRDYIMKPFVSSQIAVTIRRVLDKPEKNNKFGG